MYIIKLLENHTFRGKSDHRFEIKATKLVSYIVIVPVFNALLKTILVIF